MATVQLPGREPCPGHFIWSAFGANYPDTVCANALDWPEDYNAYGLCDADDDFREKGIPCPMHDPQSFTQYLWGEPDEYEMRWQTDDSPVPPGTEVHFHDAEALWWTAAHPERGEERVLVRRILEEN